MWTRNATLRMAPSHTTRRSAWLPATQRDAPRGSRPHNATLRMAPNPTTRRSAWLPTPQRDAPPLLSDIVLQRCELTNLGYLLHTCCILTNDHLSTQWMRELFYRPHLVLLVKFVPICLVNNKKTKLLILYEYYQSLKSRSVVKRRNKRVWSRNLVLKRNSVSHTVTILPELDADDLNVLVLSPTAEDGEIEVRISVGSQRSYQSPTARIIEYITQNCCHVTYFTGGTLVTRSRNRCILWDSPLPSHDSLGISSKSISESRVNSSNPSKNTRTAHDISSIKWVSSVGKWTPVGIIEYLITRLAALDEKPLKLREKENIINSRTLFKDIQELLISPGEFTVLGTPPSASLVSAGSIFSGQPLSQEWDHRADDSVSRS
uniref:Uncharacterized protein n=1 Tax=Timema cristinae TaxID=61476 RepID=A0A7R9CHX8_TIMCR|nr:unnamed protein product [Timema cristinae]